MLEHALKCLQWGFWIFPLRPNTKLPMTTHGFKDASNSKPKIFEWWHRWPESNIGIATGMMSKIAVVDVDVKKGARGKKSAQLIKGLLPETMRVETPSGGWHLYYYIAEPTPSRPSSVFLLPQSGIDLKADGGYIVAPGSKIDGKEYTDNKKQIVKISTGLRALIYFKGKNAVLPSYCRSPNQNDSISVSFSDGDWHWPILKSVAKMIRRGWSDAEILAKADSYTLPGWSVADTRKDLLQMIAGARRKGFDR